jgi:Amt family ammonium transporter
MTRIRIAALLISTFIFCALVAPVFAQDPAPDPAGLTTGDKGAAVDGAGNSFVVSEPTDKSAPDYAAKMKEYEDFKAQAGKEPLAMKLADTVGHVRIGSNFSWTLMTGYLVLFMQAGFALLTCGLIRKKNAGHLMMLNFAAYVFAFLAYWAVGFAFQFGAVAVNAAPVNLGGTPTLNHFLLGSGQWGFLGGKGFFMTGAGYDAGSLCLTLFEVVFMETAGYIIVGAICERITFWAFLLCELFVGALLYPIFGSWVLRDGACNDTWSATRQICAGWDAPRLPRPQSRVRCQWNIHPSLWMDGIQSGFDSRSIGPAHRGCRGEYQSCGSCRIGIGVVVLVFHFQEARYHNGV